MALFRYLHDDAFLIFSRKFRFLYEAALLDIYERFFSRGTYFPTPQEVIHAIYDVIKANPDFLAEGDDVGEGLPDVVSKRRRRIKFAGDASDTAEQALRVAGMAYQKLLQTGWLEEEEYGLRITVDMPMGAGLVIQRLASLKSDIAQRFGGVVVNVMQSLELASRLQAGATGKEASDAAFALRQARDQAEQFSKTMRAILSDLRRIKRELTESTTLRDRMDTYFEQFIGELVLKDFQAIYTFNHPYRFRDRILDLARTLSFDLDVIRAIGAGYATVGMAAGEEEGQRAAETDLLAIQEVFDAVSEMFERIASFRRQLEARLRNTVKYAEQGNAGLARRASEVIMKLHSIAERRPALWDAAWVPVPLEDTRTPWSERHLAQPRQARKPLEPMEVAELVVDPAILLIKRLQGEFQERITPSPAVLLEFLRGKVRTAAAAEAKFMRISDIDEYIAFDAIRRLCRTGKVPPLLAAEFEFEELEGAEHDSEWIRCGNFLVRRKSAGASVDAA